MKRFSLTANNIIPVIAIFGGITTEEAAPLWGAIATGSARQFELTCGTCPDPITSNPST